MVFLSFSLSVFLSFTSRHFNHGTHHVRMVEIRNPLSEYWYFCPGLWICDRLSNFFVDFWNWFCSNNLSCFSHDLIRSLLFLLIYVSCSLSSNVGPEQWTITKCSNKWSRPVDFANTHVTKVFCPLCAFPCWEKIFIHPGSDWLSKSFIQWWNVLMRLLKIWTNQ